MPHRDLLQARLLLVTGKGGTGKSTVAAGLGRLLSESGRRCLVVEVDVRQSAMGPLLGRAAEVEPRPVAPRLSVCNITRDAALEEWLDRSVPASRVVRMILKNRIVSLFLDATPGLREVVLLSRLASLVEQFEVTVVDLPATGHALGLLQVPWVAQGLVREGPIQQRARDLIALLQRPDTRSLIVALPEEMVVTETLELRDQLLRTVPGIAPPRLLLNQVAPPSLTEAERVLLDRLATSLPGLPEPDRAAAAELLAAGHWEAELERASAAAIASLGAADLWLVPRLGALGGLQGGPEAIVAQLARALQRQLLPAERA